MAQNRGGGVMAREFIAVEVVVSTQAVSVVERTLTDDILFFFSSRRRHTRCSRDWSSDVCSSDLYVRKLGEAMRLPVLEFEGYEADDVIGALAMQGAKKQLEVLIVSNDKDMMQLVGESVRTLRTGSGGAKADIIVDAEKVKEILGVPPEKGIDLMALLGDTVDNIPGAKGIGEKGATELIQKYGSV